VWGKPDTLLAVKWLPARNSVDMSAPSVVVLRDPAALADRAADHFIELAGAAIAARGSAAVALAGGSTPRAMNARLAVAPRRERVDWANVRFFFGDERCVPPDSPESNYRMTRETLFVPLGIRESQVARIHAEDEPEAAAAAYHAVLESALGSPPIFDVVYLGMGPDGHTASLFPGTIQTIDNRRYAVANFVPKFNSFRITLTPHVLNAARHVTITAAGAEKADALAAVLSGAHDPETFPAQLVAPTTGELHWFVDAAAAARLNLPVS
jgi:6-phosphogluconolactonase